MRKSDRYNLRENIDSIFLKYYKNSVFSAASLALYHPSEGLSENWYASIGSWSENERSEVSEKSFFDLASLTKPLVTLPSVLHLIDSNEISWHDTLPSLLERTIPEPFNRVALHNLLAHNSGFKAHEDYWRILNSMKHHLKKEWLIDAIVNSEAVYEKESNHLYSDLGYLLLGSIVEIKSGQRLDEYYQTHIGEPLGLTDKLFFPAGSGSIGSGPYVSTGVCRWSGDNLTGIVNDDNSRALGGITGHAGLFGSSTAVLSLCKEFLSLYHGKPCRLPIVPDTFKKACLRINDSDWTCGFNLPSVSGSSSGRFFSPKSLGHLGFTGVSFWVDVDSQLIVCLLTNRVIKGENREGIQRMRPHLHDTVVACLRK